MALWPNYARYQETEVANRKSDQALNRLEVSMALAADARPAYWVNLNVYRDCSNEVCRGLGERFLYRLHRALFRGAAYEDSRTSELMKVYGTLERGRRNGVPHLHMVIWLHHSVADKFRRRAPILWAAQAPHGGLVITPVQRGASRMTRWPGT